MPEANLNLSSIARLPRNQIKKVLAQLTDEQCDAILNDWRFVARDNQLAPDGDWQNWMVLAGRGFGKTRLGAEWVREQVKAGSTRIGLIAPTSADARDVMVEGESGLLSVSWEGDTTIDGVHLGRPIYEPSKRRLTWANGAIATMFSAEEPERLRGPQHGILWCDELAAWKYMNDTWEMAQFGLRVGKNPRSCITTTPKPLRLIRELAKAKDTVITSGSTFENAANLAPTFLRTIRERYEGTRIGRQELYAEILDEAEGALWTREMIEKAYCPADAIANEENDDGVKLARIVVAIDPAITKKEESDETGIVAAGLGVDKKGYVLADRSGRYSPDGWAKKAIGLFHELKADRIVAEGNQGGDMVRHTIRTEWANAPVTIVHASRAKAARAEPVAALYEQGKIRHVGTFPDLEDQLVTWEPLSGLPSPDRLDAVVWAITELMVKATPAAPVVGTYRDHK